MIKVIKHGEQKFLGKCDRCGCEFIYDLDDISISNSVPCPDCIGRIYHKLETNRIKSNADSGDSNEQSDE